MAFEKDARNSHKKGEWNNRKTLAAAIIGISAFAFVIFIVIALVMGLGRIRPIESNETEAAVIGECGGFEVRYEELRYITLLYRADLESRLGKYDELDSDGKAEFEDELKKLVFENIENNYVVLSLCEELGVDTAAKKYDRYAQDQIERLVAEELDGDKKKYESFLAANNLTDSLLRLIFKTDALESELLDMMSGDDSDVAYYEENKLEFVDYIMNSGDYVRTIHVYYPKTHPWKNKSNVPAEVLAVDKEYIEKTVESYDPISSIEKAYADVTGKSNDDDRLKAMKSAIGYTPVTEFAVSGNGFFFTYGQMGEQYERISYALEEYGVSKIFEYEDGYCFVMRLPLIRDHVSKNVDDFLADYHYLALKKKLDGVREKISFEPSGEYADIKLIDIQ